MIGQSQLLPCSILKVIVISTKMNDPVLKDKLFTQYIYTPKIMGGGGEERRRGERSREKEGEGGIEERGGRERLIC